MTVKHIVMWDLRGETVTEKAHAADLVKAKFEGLRGKIPGLRFLEVGIDFSGVDYACDVVLYSVFDDQEALRAYANHPAHLRVRDELAGLRIGRHQVDFLHPAPSDASK